MFRNISQSFCVGFNLVYKDCKRAFKCALKYNYVFCSTIVLCFRNTFNVNYTFSFFIFPGSLLILNYNEINRQTRRKPGSICNVCSHLQKKNKQVLKPPEKIKQIYHFYFENPYSQTFFLILYPALSFDRLETFSLNLPSLETEKWFPKFCEFFLIVFFLTQ